MRKQKQINSKPFHMGSSYHYIIGTTASGVVAAKHIYWLLNDRLATIEVRRIESSQKNNSIYRKKLKNPSYNHYVIGAPVDACC